MLTEKDLQKRYSEILSMVFTKGYTLDMNKSVPYRMFFYKGHNALSVSLVEEYVQTGWKIEQEAVTNRHPLTPPCARLSND